jgi:hypothetical protein
MKDSDWADATIVFAASTCWSKDLMSTLSKVCQAYHNWRLHLFLSRTELSFRECIVPHRGMSQLALHGFVYNSNAPARFATAVMPSCGFSPEISLDSPDLYPRSVEVTHIPLATGLRETSGRCQGGDDDPEARARLQEVEPGEKDARMVIVACQHFLSSL